MVQKYQSPVRVYKYPFEIVMAAYEKRFPTCKMIPVFVGSEIMFEFKSDDEAEHVIERRCKLNIDAPYLLKKISGVDFVYFIQKNSLDWRHRTLKIDAHNETFSSRVIVNETCQYSVHPENSDWTCFEQEASLDIKSFFGFESTVERIAMKQYTANIQKGKEVIEFYINELLSEGITYIPSYCETRGETQPQRAKADALKSVMSTTVERRRKSTYTPSQFDDEDMTSGGARSCDTGIGSQPDSELESSIPYSSTSSEHQSERTTDDGFECNGDVDSNRRDTMASKAATPKLSADVEQASTSSHRKPSLKPTGGDGDAACAAAAGVDLPSDPHRRTLSFLQKVRSSSKLSYAYIERYIAGALTPYQDSCLVRLRRYIRETHHGKMPKDAHILRFLRARDFNFDDAQKMLCHSLAWRKLHSIDLLLDTYAPPPVLVTHFPGVWHHSDRDGRPLYVLRLGSMDVKGLLKSVGEEGLMRHVIAIIELGLRKADENTRSLGHPVSSCTCVVDLEHLSMRHLWRPGIRTLLRIIEVVQANYPETMGRLLIIRAPRVFPVLWTLISSFIDENTRKKFMIYGGNDYLGPGGLVDFIDADLIPDFLGGPARCEINEGRLVPRSNYMFAEKDLDDNLTISTLGLGVPLCGQDSIYHLCYVSKDAPHEVLIQVPQRGSVITWDFDVLKGVVKFAIYRSCRVLSAEADRINVAASSASERAQSANQAGSQERVAMAKVQSSQYIDSKAVIGVDFSIVEPSTICRDGDSMQGSHLTTHAGSYIIQWKYNDRSTISLSAHKSRVMYYTELLRSDDFKGSMTSLRSCASGFSSLSGGPNHNHHVRSSSSVSGVLGAAGCGLR